MNSKREGLPNNVRHAPEATYRKSDEWAATVVQLRSELDADLARFSHAQELYQSALQVREELGFSFPSCDEVITITSHYKAFAAESYFIHLRALTDFVLGGKNFPENTPSGTPRRFLE